MGDVRFVSCSRSFFFLFLRLLSLRGILCKKFCVEGLKLLLEFGCFLIVRLLSFFANDFEVSFLGQSCYDSSDVGRDSCVIVLVRIGLQELRPTRYFWRFLRLLGRFCFPDRMIPEPSPEILGNTSGLRVDVFST